MTPHTMTGIAEGRPAIAGIHSGPTRSVILFVTALSRSSNATRRSSGMPDSLLRRHGEGRIHQANTACGAAKGRRQYQIRLHRRALTSSGLRQVVVATIKNDWPNRLARSIRPQALVAQSVNAGQLISALRALQVGCIVSAAAHLAFLPESGICGVPQLAARTESCSAPLDSDLARLQRDLDRGLNLFARSEPWLRLRRV